jgi:hypothetical protein
MRGSTVAALTLALALAAPSREAYAQGGQEAPSPAPTPAAAPQAQGSSSGAAQPSSEARALAETLFFAGRGLMEAGRYADACQKFAESLRLDRAAGTLLNLAVCHEKEGKIASAWGEFKEALSDAKKLGRADREELASSHIATLEPDLPYLTIHVPDGARVGGLEVVRNGNPLRDGSWGTALPVDPGDVEIVTRAPGYKPRSQRLSIERTEKKEFTVDALEKAPVPVVFMAEPGWSRRRKIGVAVGAAGVVALGVGAYFGIRALGLKSKSDDNCPVFDAERRCTESGSSSMSSARTDAWAANIGIGVGAAAAIVGTWLFVTGGNEKKGPDVTPAVTAGPTGGACMLRGSF